MPKVDFFALTESIKVYEFAIADLEADGDRLVKQREDAPPALMVQIDDSLWRNRRALEIMNRALARANAQLQHERDRTGEKCSSTT